jgi:hypothetical protein
MFTVNLWTTKSEWGTDTLRGGANLGSYADTTAAIKRAKSEMVKHPTANWASVDYIRKGSWSQSKVIVTHSRVIMDKKDIAKFLDPDCPGSMTLTQRRYLGEKY